MLVADVRHISRICIHCGGKLEVDAPACPWCGTRAHSGDGAQRLRVRKKRSALTTYFEHVRRHKIYFLLAILAALLSAWFLIDYAQRPAQKAAPASIMLPELMGGGFSVF